MRSDLTIESRMEEVARARRWLTRHASDAGFPEDEVRRLGLAVSEACTNVIRHAYGGEPGKPIELHLEIDETSLKIRIRDLGRRFDLTGYEPPDLSEPQEGGYGILIIRSVMDSVEYDASTGEGTTLTLTKHRPAPHA